MQISRIQLSSPVLVGEFLGKSLASILSSPAELLSLSSKFPRQHGCLVLCPREFPPNQLRRSLTPPPVTKAPSLPRHCPSSSLLWALPTPRRPPVPVIYSRLRLEPTSPVPGLQGLPSSQSFFRCALSLPPRRVHPSVSASFFSGGSGFVL